MWYTWWLYIHCLTTYQYIYIYTLSNYCSVTYLDDQAFHRHIPILIRSLGSSCSELLHIISDPPQGSENLLTLVGSFPFFVTVICFNLETLLFSDILYMNDADSDFVFWQGVGNIDSRDNAFFWSDSHC